MKKPVLELHHPPTPIHLIVIHQSIYEVFIRQDKFIFHLC